MQFVTVTEFFNQSEADLAVAELEAAGFPVFLHSEHSGPFSGILRFRVQVPEDRVADARQLLEGDASPEPT
jgi:hypothetical protein